MQEPPKRKPEAKLKARIRCNPRPLARARYEFGEDNQQVTLMVIREIDRMIAEGRVPLNVACFALECSLDTLRDRLAEESVSWADDPARARTHGGDRGLGEMDE